MLLDGVGLLQGIDYFVVKKECIILIINVTIYGQLYSLCEGSLASLIK